MKDNKRIPIWGLALMFSLLLAHFVEAGVIKWIRVGRLQNKVVDYGDQGESSGEGTFAYDYYDKFQENGWDHAGWNIGTKNWTDEKGNHLPVKISGAAHGTANERENTIPVSDDLGNSIFRYLRFQPPTVTVDGMILNTPFPQRSDDVKPEKIPGTADILVESWINTSMGLTIHQRVLGWSQRHHDQYLIYDWTFINTGNVDADREIELPNQTLQDVYFMRANNYVIKGYGLCWNSCYGEHPSDSLRISYTYPSRGSGASFDDFGNPDLNSGFLQAARWIGEATLHADESTGDHTDDPSQPYVTASNTAELLWIKNEANINSPADHALLYQTMSQGFQPFDGTPYMTGSYPGTFHSLRMDEQGVKFPDEMSWWNWRGCTYTCCGPYTVAPGDSFRIVWATVIGTISPEKGWEIGRAWLNKESTWDGPNNLPDPVEENKYYDDDNDYAKDCWISTGKDSLFMNASAAQWAVRNHYDVPIPPPAPSVEVKSLPDGINILWGNESESASDFAGYRVYRAVGDPDTTYFPVFECGTGTENALTHEYIDAQAQRGIAYFYYVAAFDDGIENKPDFNGSKESLESGKYLNRTTKAAYLTRPEGSLSKARIVPNPFNIGAKNLQFIGEPDKIMFFDIPGVCTIKIYSESGDLVKTIEHTDGSGDESWGVLLEEHSTTNAGQVIVSGIYIAHIEAPTGESVNLKFVVVR